MRLSTSWGRAALGIPLALCVAVSAVAQVTPGEPGFYVRTVDSGGTIDSQTKSDNVFSEGPVLGVAEGIAPFVDYGGGGGTFADTTQAYQIEVAEDFVVTAWTDVTIPAGEWGLACGSDDGCLVEILPKDGSVFEWNLGKFSQNGDDVPGQIRFEGNRGHSWTLGGFELAEPLEATIRMQMHERGGGDSFEVAVTDIAPFDGDTVTDGDWFLLGGEEGIDFDDVFDWGFKTPDPIPSISIPASPGQLVNGTATNVTKEEVGEVKSGLLHHWYGRNNPGSLEGVSEFYDINAGPLEEPDIVPFNPENTWWTGNQAALVGGTTEAPKYPAEIIDQERLDGTSFGGTDNSNYTTALTGELRFPRDGEYTFTDGVDDLTIWAVDVDRDGEFDPDTEILINDNAWTSLNRDSNDGGFPNEYVPITIDVPEDGNCDDAENASDLCWFRVEAVFGEGGGTDAGIIYWNENGDIEFPTENGDGRIIADEDIGELAIPENFLRAPGGIVITGAELAASLNGDFPYEFEVNEDGTFDSIGVNRSIGVATTSLDLNGATINLVANGDLSGLEGEFQILSADAISGDITVNVPEGMMVDTSRVASEGILVFGDAAPPVGIAGDIDGDGSVGFSDFLILSANFGMAGGADAGDIDGDGNVGFPDFLTLSANFGQAAGAAAVPEPSSVCLLGLGGLLLGMVRRRRR